jgi:hypothetical protein
MIARGVPSLLLSTETLLGVTRAPRELGLAAMRRYEAPDALAAAFRGALEAGAEGVVVTPSPATRAALRGAGRDVPAYALVPNVPAYVRDSSELGLVGAALKRVKGAPPATLVRLGLTGVGHVREVLANDLQGMVPVLLELECASLAAPRLESVLLASTLTDLALAGRHRRFFAHYVEFVRRRFGARAGFETHNLGTLLTRLAEWNVSPDLVVGPVNPRGLMMKPDAASTLAALAAASFPVLAKELRAGGSCSLEEGARYARAHGAAGVLADLVDLEDGVNGLARLRA